MKYFSKTFFTIIIFSAFLFPSSSSALLISGPPPIISDVSIEPNKVKVNQTITIKAKVVGEENNNVSFVGASFPELGIFFIMLSDDGISPDETAGDDIYTNIWTVPEDIPLGEYQVAIVAMGENGGEAIDYSGKFEVVLNKFSPEKYAPNLWFDSQEEYYPTDPFFDGNKNLSGEDNKTNYEALKNFENKLDRFTVYYHIVEMPAETVYQYFFYYAYNKMPKANEHYHDWETVFVFVDNDTEKVNRVVASAHGNWRPHNEYFNPQLKSDEHIGILIEQGSHANCTDRNNDGLFERNIDITNGWIGLFRYAHGIWDRENDDLNGYRIYAEDPQYSLNLELITDDFIERFGRDENGEQLKTFPESPVKGLCVEIPSFFGLQPCIPIGGNPPEHPWHNEAYDKPYKIIPKLNNFINGTINPFGSLEMQGIVLVMSEEPYPFTFTDENGEFLINNIPEGEHNIIVNLENYAPYKQRFIIDENGNEENEIIVGVDGILNLIPENEAFKLKGTVKNSEGNIIVNSEINIYDENGKKLFTTLTDKGGHYLFNLSSNNIYTVEVIQEDKIEISENIKGAVGEELIANLSIENPRSLKIQAIDDLESIENNNRIIKRNIQKTIGLINKSLNKKYWIDDSHLNKRQGRKVFHYELRTVARLKLLEKLNKKLKLDDKQLSEILKNTENRLAKADFLLAEIALDEAKNTEIKNNRFKKRIDKFIKKAEKELKKAKKKLEKDKQIKSIIHSQRSWYYSNAAIRLADK